MRSVEFQTSSNKRRTDPGKETASVPVVGFTANHAIRQKAKPTGNNSVFVAGGAEASAGGLGSTAIQILEMIGIENVVTMSGRDASRDLLVKELRLSPHQVIDYRGKDLKQLTQEALAANDGRLFDKVLDFVGGELKRLCFELVDFDGDIFDIDQQGGDRF